MAIVNHLQILQSLFQEVFIPEAVHKEILQGGASSAGLSAYGKVGWVNVRPLTSPLDPLLGSILDFGEASVIQLAQQLGVKTVYKPRRIPSKTWRELIKKIWEVDPLTGPRCGREMKILSLINDPDVIERILRHLGWWKQQAVPYGRKTKAPEHGPVVIEDFGDGRPRYEEPSIVYH